MIAKSRLSLVIVGSWSSGAIVPPITSKMHVSRFLLDRFEQSAKLLAEFRVVGVAVTDNSVVYRRVEHLFFGALDSQRAAVLTRIIAAVNRFSI